jgi:tetratricopeptide (TPR) repeat protein
MLKSLALLLLFSASAVKADTTASSYRDTIFARFMRPAWQEPLFSHRRMDLIDSALKYLPQDAYVWQQRGMPLAKQRKYELALRYTDSAVKYDERRWLGYRAFMKTIFNKDYESALVDLNRCEKLRPGAEEMDHPWRFWMGLCFLQLNEFDSAETSLKQVFDRDMKYGDGWLHVLHALYYGIALYEQRKYQNAANTIDLALKSFPDFADAQYYKALCLIELGKKHDALALLEAAKVDLEAAKTFNEDNSVYEMYPYQIHDWMVDGMIRRLTKSP